MDNPRTPSSAKQRRILKAICRKEPNTIRAAVAKEALEFPNPLHFFNALQQGGCRSGIVLSLSGRGSIYAFFDRHEDEFEELLEEFGARFEDFEERYDEALRTKYGMMKFLVWFAFEETAHRMAREDLGLDL